MKRSFSRYMAVAGLAVLVYVLPQVAQAVDNPAPAKPAVTAATKAMAFTGRIEAIDAKAGSVTVKHGDTTKVFELAKDCKFGEFATKVSGLADLKVGQHIQISYTEKDHKMIASEINTAPHAKAATVPPAK